MLWLGSKTVCQILELSKPSFAAWSFQSARSLCQLEPKDRSHIVAPGRPLANPNRSVDHLSSEIMLSHLRSTCFTRSGANILAVEYSDRGSSRTAIAGKSFVNYSGYKRSCGQPYQGVANLAL